MHDQGVTVVVTRTIKAGREADYEAWLRGVAEVAGRFKGHLGMTVFRPRAGSRDYTFASGSTPRPTSPHGISHRSVQTGLDALKSWLYR